MKIISVVNLKGGVGKTTTVVNMAALLAREWDKRVLVVDCDPQANATQFFETELSDNLTMLLDGSLPTADELIVETPVHGVELIPAGMGLVNADISSLRRGVAMDTLRAALSELSDRYHFVLIDCPPSFTAASCAAILASEEVIIPVKPDGFVLGGARDGACRAGGGSRGGQGPRDRRA